VLNKEIPFLRLGLPLCAGILTGLYIKPDSIFLSVSLLLITSGFAAGFFFNKYQTNIIYGVALTCSLFLCGLVLYTREKTSLSTLKSEKSTFLCTLNDFPEEKASTYMMTVRLQSKVLSGSSETIKGSLMLYCRKDSSLLKLIPGDILLFRCTPVEIENRGNPCEFDYKFFMENQGIRYYAFINSNDLLRHFTPKNRKLIHRALITREKIISMFRERGIRGERLALVSAITLGQKRMLDPEQKLIFIKAGVMHIMAVSGLHAIILSLFIFNLLFFMKGRFNLLRVIITITMLWAFAFITGLTPSVLRATLMYSFLQAGKLMKRPANSINLVLASAFVLIINRPSVIFDAGFLLSYSAVVYIISFYQGFYQLLFFKNWLADKIWQSAAVTIVAQAGTLPLTIFLFNRFPTYFILANITIVPISNLLIITGCSIPLFFHIRFLSTYLAMLLNYLTILTEKLTAFAASLPYSSLENIGLTLIGCLLLVFTIFAFSRWLVNRRSFSPAYPLFFLALFCIYGLTCDIFKNSGNELIIYNTPGSSTIGIKTGRILNLYTDTTLIRPEVSRHCATLGLKINKSLLDNSCSCIEAGNKKILLTAFINPEIIRKYLPDIVILTGKRPEIGTNVNYTVLPVELIITSAAANSFHFPPETGLSGIDSVHFVRKTGAYVKRL
jgi:competence protein ComEC